MSVLDDTDGAPGLPLFDDLHWPSHIRISHHIVVHLAARCALSVDLGHACKHGMRTLDASLVE